MKEKLKTIASIVSVAVILNIAILGIYIAWKVSIGDYDVNGVVSKMEFLRAIDFDFSAIFDHIDFNRDGKL